MHINAAIGADGRCAGVVQGGGVQAEVFQRAAETDEEFALVAIDGGQGPRRGGQLCPDGARVAAVTSWRKTVSLTFMGSPYLS